jgi:small conductance mechanosensitive channel
MDWDKLIQDNLPLVVELAQGILLCVVILVLGWVAAKWAERLMQRSLERRMDNKAVARFLSGMARYAVLAAAVIGALNSVGIETTSLVALLGSAGLAVGLALQGNLSHFASGVMLLFFRPFQIDDVVTVAGHTGQVMDIGLFATTLHTPTGERIIIPNGAVAGSSIVNITVRGMRRGTVSVGVAYGADVEATRAVLLAAAKRCSLVLEDPAPAVGFANLSASSIDFNVHCWSRSADYLAMLDQVRVAVYDDLNAAGIEIPFNQIVVHRAASDVVLPEGT